MWEYDLGKESGHPARFLLHCGLEVRAPFFPSLDSLEITQRPGFVEVGLGWFVETEVGEPTLARDGWDPVSLRPHGSSWTAIDIYRTIRVLL